MHEGAEPFLAQIDSLWKEIISQIEEEQWTRWTKEQITNFRKLQWNVFIEKYEAYLKAIHLLNAIDEPTPEDFSKLIIAIREFKTLLEIINKEAEKSEKVIPLFDDMKKILDDLEKNSIGLLALENIDTNFSFYEENKDDINNAKKLLKDEKKSLNKKEGLYIVGLFILCATMIGALFAMALKDNIMPKHIDRPRKEINKKLHVLQLIKNGDETLAFLKEGEALNLKEEEVKEHLQQQKKGVKETIGKISEELDLDMQARKIRRQPK